MLTMCTCPLCVVAQLWDLTTALELFHKLKETREHHCFFMTLIFCVVEPFVMLLWCCRKYHDGRADTGRALASSHEL